MFQITEQRKTIQEEHSVSLSWWVRDWSTGAGRPWLLEVVGKVPERRELSGESSTNLHSLTMNYKLCVSRVKLDRARQRPTIREKITTRELWVSQLAELIQIWETLSSNQSEQSGFIDWLNKAWKWASKGATWSASKLIAHQNRIFITLWCRSQTPNTLQGKITMFRVKTKTTRHLKKAGKHNLQQGEKKIQ